MNGRTDSEEYEEVRVPVPWGYITGKWWGPLDVQPIIAIHGWQDNCCTFDKLAPILKDKGYSVYCIDLPGHGFSSPFPKGQYYYVFWDGVHLLRRIVKHFDWKEISIMGHSLGGGIGFLYSAVYPKEVKKYVSIDIASPFVRSISSMADGVGSSIDKFLEYEKKYLSGHPPPTYQYEEALQFMFEGRTGATKESAEILSKRGTRPASAQDGYVFTRDPRLKVSIMGYISLDQAMELASRITCEVLNIKATEGIAHTRDIDIAYDEILDQIGKQAKRLERELMEGTHYIHLNDAEVMAPYVYNFLAS